ncbi:MAG: Na+/H+ antiporter subunit C [Gemmatimonadales bacterium]|nr:MAG: Na+/H+ antiporter subunit C [Gemmatimonadales bacterium]
MTPLDLYTLAGAALFVLGIHALMVRAHLVWKVLGFNVAGGGIFLVLLAASPRVDPLVADPVPQAMVLTGIVVAVAATAVALGLALRVTFRTGSPFLVEEVHADLEEELEGEDEDEPATGAAAES